ncbi:DUF4192 domain-containing protein [Nocardia jiangxiensis]|uniref:DUF4192 domain-containing protein n=1 Tax=Nocardia jiangxiensis TaxID=282685 RepID=A0ABW6RYU5_9NOCA
MDSSRNSLGDVGELIAALPALLGFYPESSVVLVACAPPPDDVAGHLQLEAVMRADLDSCLHTDSTGIDATVRMCLGNNVRQIAVLVIDEALDANDTSERGRACQEFLARLRIALLEAGIELVGGWFTTAVRAQEYWWSFLDSEHGTIPDPAASPVTLATEAATGQRIYGARAEVVATLEQDVGVVEAVRSHLPEAADAAERHAAAVTAQDPHADIRHGVELVLSYLDTTTELTPARLAEVAVALQDSRIRDCLVGLAATSSAVPAQRLWTDLTRTLPAPARAEAAALLAFGAYAGRTGPLAGIAVDIALEANPKHRIGRILRVALDAGFPPEQIYQLAREAVAHAAEVGVTLPGAEQQESL